MTRRAFVYIHLLSQSHPFYFIYFSHLYYCLFELGSPFAVTHGLVTHLYGLLQHVVLGTTLGKATSGSKCSYRSSYNSVGRL